MMEVQPTVIQMIELTKGEVRNLAGHERGLAAREKFKLKDLDRSDASVPVIFPADFRQVSSSFFQGMFAESVQKLGSLARFMDHYRFDAPSHIRAKIVDYADQIITRSQARSSGEN